MHRQPAAALEMEPTAQPSPGEKVERIELVIFGGNA
jgi:hypothetical protein